MFYLMEALNLFHHNVLHYHDVLLTLLLFFTLQFRPVSSLKLCISINNDACGCESCVAQNDSRWFTRPGERSFAICSPVHKALILHFYNLVILHWSIFKTEKQQKQTGHCSLPSIWRPVPVFYSQGQYYNCYIKVCSKELLFMTDAELVDRRERRKIRALREKERCVCMTVRKRHLL